MLDFRTFYCFEANSHLEHMSRFVTFLRFESVLLLEHLHTLVTKLKLLGQRMKYQVLNMIRLDSYMNLEYLIKKVHSQN